MLKVNISEFRANLLKYLEMANAGEEICVTSSGKLLATISAPVDLKAQAHKQLKDLAKTAKIRDVITPTGSNWEALS